jgi:tRNA(fMet)-specific endonuclease VapC
VSARFLLDTNVLSEAVKPAPNPGVMRNLRRWSAQAVTAAPVWHELVYGCRRLPPTVRRQTLERYLFETLAPVLVVLPYDEQAAAWHAGERARLEAQGKTPAFVDGQIAAVASTRKLVLVTANLRHFEPFSELDVEDWSS